MTRPLVVVGVPRSGTTWMAQALAAAVGGGNYIHEPFNHRHHPERRRWFLRMPSGSDRGDVSGVVDEALRSVPAEPAPVVKDVHAIFVLAAVASDREWPLVVAVRHPCAMVTSRLELGLHDTGLPELLAQEVVMDGPLADMSHHLRRCRGDIASELGAVWGAALLLLRTVVPPSTAWLSHEAMCRAPAAEVLATLAVLGCGGGAADEAHLQEWLATYDRPGGDQMNIFRVAATQPDRWRHDLAPELATRVLAAAAPFEQFDLLDRSSLGT